MKKLIIIFLALLIVSCGSRIKTKHSSETKYSKEQIDSVETTVISNGQIEEITKKNDSSTINFEQKNQRNLKTDYLTFSLKNNGKCLDNSAIRFVTIEDKSGNKASVPVNDNTDLIYNNSNTAITDSTSFKLSQTRLENINNYLRNNISILTKTVASQKASIAKLETENEMLTKSKKSSFWLFVIVSIASIIVGIYIKKLLIPFI